MRAALRAVDPVAEAKVLGQATDADVPVVSRPIEPRVKSDLGAHDAVAGLAKHEADRRRVPTDKHEVDAARGADGPSAAAALRRRR